MFNQQLITERLELIRSSVLRLKALTGMSLEDFQGNEDAQDIAENRLRKALEALFDLGRHIAVKSGAGIPHDYRSVIAMLSEKDILPADFCHEITGMAGYRNRLMHEYNKVTVPELYDILQTKLSDFELFCQYITKYLTKQ
ncbi:type VII toxin-antitoxin system HepT family RNase toxin [Desulfoscipio gibsoniae]|uniref:DUF86 domain-containing protein n=1 Tax=Desulfoscipio gibsoniae DSM 7213 TaxID=767817 RepID=R4KNN0_9FIRM|nr:DUF86 domain-containing protein [Desulfoscipio gibsoniae]AGL02155.1 hypothetical protein Desgi_2751 [Desulfoscipio gibsoniae DSM 7213]